ncbi:EF-hand calcium-binding domain-containing protein 11 isoform X6 [Lutra lutra]|uniref:EF-hand calcium-binding domain-containing protein 11 isoform X6 n=1 Tax=Lutra lutra TaxID=9657 RepID=UPI001FD4D2FE|nr:EF-hand calcium-binding domain-containing protein 11 isoform X6 [Lutra lutra]
MVAMFFSEAGARPWTWEASPSEHKKWVEIEADFTMSSVNPNASGILLEEFLSIVRKKKEVRLHWNEIRHIFTAFDRHYRGYLTLEDFKKAFKQVAPKLSERTVLDVFRCSWVPSLQPRAHQQQPPALSIDGRAPASWDPRRLSRSISSLFLQP